MDGSVVDHSFRTARRTVIAAFAVSVAIIVVLVAERFAFERGIVGASKAARDAVRLNGDILLADERLTMSANMAAATGEQRWMKRYDDNLPFIDDAIAAARELAPPEVSQRFDAETRLANDLLVGMETRSFELDRQGRLGEARAILDGPDYARQKKILADGSDRFAAALLQATQHDLDAVRTRSLWIFVGLLAAAGAGFFVLWKYLTGTLTSSRGAYLDAERRVHSLALHDPLTGLPNRRFFQQELTRLLQEDGSAGRRTAVIMLDLDRFKPINDRLGHAVGDVVLVEIGKILRGTLSPRDFFCARLGGDEFAVATSFSGDRQQPYLAATRIIASLSAPLAIDGLPHTLGATAGIAMSPDDAGDIGELVRKADIALCRAKRLQRGSVAFFEDAMDEEIRSLAEVDADLERAIAEGEIVPYFQPVVNLASGQVEHFEVLARWQHPSRGLLSPAAFIPAAEQLGLIDDVFATILEQSCRAAKSWPAEIGIAVNLAPQQLARPDLPQRVLAILAAAGFPPRRLEIELTESALIGNLAETRAIVTSLKNQGVRFALDDFGAGHSSLRQLRSLPFDRLKIDGSFVKAMASDPEAAKIVHAVIMLGRNLGLATTGEWVESAEIAAALAAAGCDSGQGFEFGKPVPAAEAREILTFRQLKRLAS